MQALTDVHVYIYLYAYIAVSERLGGYNLFEKKKSERAEKRIHILPFAIFTINSRLAIFFSHCWLCILCPVLLSRAFLLILFMHRFISIQFEKLFVQRHIIRRHFNYFVHMFVLCESHHCCFFYVHYFVWV